MIKSLELENFKAFGERVKIPFAPITLIFGENSSGKSSILQSLNLLKQTRESRETKALLLPRTENGISDLGSFQDLLFDHDLSRSLTIKIALNLQKLDYQNQHDIKRVLSGYDIFSDLEVENVGIEFKFSRESLEKQILLHEIGIFLDEACIVKFRVTLSDTADKLPVFEVTQDAQIWNSRFNFCKKRKKEILKFLQDMLLKQRSYIENESQSKINKKGIYFHEIQSTLSNSSINSIVNYEKMDLSKEKKLEKLIEESIDFYSTEFTIKDFSNRATHGHYVGEYIQLENFLPISVENKSAGLPEEIYIKSLDSYKASGSYKEKILTLDFSKLAVLFGKSLKQMFQVLFPLGPFRKAPERWYIFSGTDPKDVGYKGDQLPSLLLRNSRLVEETNYWLKKLDIGYQLKVEFLGEKLKDIFEVRLVDIRRSKPVEIGLSDVGFGVSQILPFIVQSLVLSEKIISIEQPEVHIHPRLQADLGDLLAHSIKKRPYNNQFIIETHSEHLVLRLQKLVSIKKLSPNDVSIIYVSRGTNGSKVQQLQLDEDGDFIDDWPGGFFPERLRELR